MCELTCRGIIFYCNIHCRVLRCVGDGVCDMINYMLFEVIDSGVDGSSGVSLLLDDRLVVEFPGRRRRRRRFSADYHIKLATLQRSLRRTFSSPNN